jgi:beta-glucosidase
LPGSEGAGVADVLVGDADGAPRHDFTGRLSFSWPATPDQADVNVGDDPYEPLFAYGYGLSYEEPTDIGMVTEDPGQVDRSENTTRTYIDFGDPVGPWRLNLEDLEGDVLVYDVRGSSPAGVLSVHPADHAMQEDTFVANWTGPARLFINGPRVNLQRETTGDYVLSLRYRVVEANPSRAVLAMGEGAIDVTAQLTSQAGEGWQASHVKLSCFAEAGADMGSMEIPLMLTVEGRLELQITSAKLAPNPGKAGCTL